MTAGRRQHSWPSRWWRWHTLLTWPLREVLALFLGGAVLAFAAEVEVDLWSYPEARVSRPRFGGSRGGTSPGGW